MDGNDAYEIITKRLREAGVPFTIHQHEVARTVTDAEERLPFPREQFLKTVVFRIKNSTWILAAVRGQDSVDYRKLAAALGVKRADLIRPSAEDIENLLGYEIGGICPVPIQDGIEVVYDSIAAEMDIVYCGSGRNDRTLEIKVHDLIQVTGGRVLTLVRDL